MKHLIAIIISLSFIMVGCSTMPIVPETANKIPESRIINKDLAKPSSDRNLKVTFLRDDHYVSICRVMLYYQGEEIAILDRGEMVSFYFKEGEYRFGVKFGENGFCAMTPYKVYQISILEGRDNNFRLLNANSGAWFFQDVQRDESIYY